MSLEYNTDTRAAKNESSPPSSKSAETKSAETKGAGAELGLLLRSGAVNYAVKEQDAGGLRFGGVAQTQPARLSRDISSLVDKGVSVYVVSDDASDRGLERTDLVPGVESRTRAQLAELYADYDEVWSW